MMLFDEVGYVFFKGLCLLFFQNIPVAMFIQEAMLIPESRVAFKESTSQYSYKLSTFELWLELAWPGLGQSVKDKHHKSLKFSLLCT